MTAADLSALLISLREGIEMALVVGILLAYLSQVGARRAHRWVWAGVGAAAAVSLGFLAISAGLCLFAAPAYAAPAPRARPGDASSRDPVRTRARP